MIDAVEHSSYVEPFGGMGGVFFRRVSKPRAEVINDYKGDVANLFRILQRHYVAFVEMMRFQLTTRREFGRLLKVRPETLTDLERAARFLYLQRLKFGGLPQSSNFGVAVDRPARFDILKLAPMLEEIHERLSGVVIENLDFEELISRYDRPETLFYCDPPYWGSEDFYGRELFRRSDFARLAEVLGQIRGKFILSLNDVAEIRQMFRRFDIKPVQTVYSLSSGRPVKSGELLICG